jgi:peroxiredoxin
MLYISVESRKKASEYARQKGLPYTVLVDEGAEVAKNALGVSSIPAHFILDLEGKVRFRNTGRIKEHEEALDRLVKEMQAKKAG